MTDRIKLVRNDTRPQIIVDITESSSGLPIDVSSATVRLKFRMEAETTLIATLVATKLAGRALDDGTVDTNPPYDTPGVGGRVVFSWADAPGALEGEAGNYEGEIEMEFIDGTIQTVYDLMKFKLREDF